MTRFIKQLSVITIASLLCLSLASRVRENGGAVKVAGESIGGRRPGQANHLAWKPALPCCWW